MLDRLTSRLRGLAGREGPSLRVFVSYRREAGPGQAHHLATDLERRLGAGSVFLDERAIGAGEDFDAVISERVGGADVLVAVIGPGWVDMQPRLADERDYVRREIEAAIARRVPVIAVATPGAAMPSPADLPPGMRAMLERPALAIDIHSDALWAVAVESLAAWLAAIRDEKHAHDRDLRRAVGARAAAELELERAREREAAAQAAGAGAAEREAGLEAELPVAREELDRRRAEAEPARSGPRLRVLVSHREECGAEAERLAADLGARLGAERIGRTAAADGAVEDADAVLVLIGPGWQQEAASPDGVRARRELALALGRRVAVIPLLVRHAALPAADALPDELRPLLGHQALLLPEQFWDAALGRIAERLDEIERSIARREQAVEAARGRCAQIERDLERAHRAVAGAREDAAQAAGRVAALEAALAAAQEGERDLVAWTPDANRAYLAGPPAPR